MKKTESTLHTERSKTQSKQRMEVVSVKYEVYSKMQNKCLARISFSGFFLNVLNPELLSIKNDACKQIFKTGILVNSLYFTEKMSNY